MYTGGLKEWFQTHGTPLLFDDLTGTSIDEVLACRGNMDGHEGGNAENSLFINFATEAYCIKNLIESTRENGMV
jgi:hypothetical protein